MKGSISPRKKMYIHSPVYVSLVRDLPHFPVILTFTLSNTDFCSFMSIFSKLQIRINGLTSINVLKGATWLNILNWDCSRKKCRTYGDHIHSSQSQMLTGSNRRNPKQSKISSICQSKSCVSPNVIPVDIFVWIGPIR